MIGFGGGLFADLAQHVVVRNVIFRNNLAIGKSVTNEAEWGGNGAGGGAAFRLVDDALLESVAFDGNSARGSSGPTRPGYGSGGGLFTNESTVIGRNLTFTNNLARTGDGGNGESSNGERAAAFGGAADFQEGSRILFQQVSAVGNSAIAGDTTMVGSGAFGGAFKAELADVTLIDVEIRGNQAIGGNAVNGWYAAGGGLEAIHSSITMVRARILDNLARGGNGTTGDQGPAGGGGVNVAWVSPVKNSVFKLVNSVVAGNSIEQGDGTIVTGGGGGGLFLQGTAATIEHSTIAGNHSDASMAGQGILLIESSVGSPNARSTTADINWSILADHTGFPWWQMAALYVRPGNTVVLNRGLFANNSHDANADGVPGPAGNFTGLETMLSAPLAMFVAPVPSFDYHLAAGSPARDHADGSSQPIDFDFESRSRGGAPDIGADEYVSVASSGEIAGTVTAASGGAAQTVSVTAFEAGTVARVTGALTDAMGQYHLTGLAAGSYVVRFGLNDGLGGYVGEWHSDALDDASATPVTVSSNATSTVNATLERVPSCDLFSPSIVGTIGPDVLQGTPGPDVIVGAGGDDVITGLGGDDVICGGAGNDDITGGNGDDWLNGGVGDDLVEGGKGNDVLRDGAGNDVLRGNAGNDNLRDRKGSNTLAGGGGTDACNSRPENTLLSCSP